MAASGRDPDEGKIERGWRLTQVAWKLIRHDGTMLLLAFAGMASSGVFTAAIFFFGGYFSHPGHTDGSFALVALICLYPSVLVALFFNVALASAASAAFDGDHLTLREALRHAYGKKGRIAAWALISAVVGTVISEIANRLPGGAKLVGWLAGAAWGLATIFVVPILAMDSVGAVDALKRSARLAKSRWGEGVSGNVAIGAWAVIAALPLGMILGFGFAVGEESPGTGVALVATALVGLVMLSAAVAASRQVFAVALYRYAIDAPVGGFHTGDLEYPFTPRRSRKLRKSWILRIGGAILALFAILVAVSALVGPPVPHTRAQGYFDFVSTKQRASGLRDGATVLFDGRKIGEVVQKTARRRRMVLTVHVDPRFRAVMESRRAFPKGPPAFRYLCIGTRAEC
jgi:hypothetical protein